MLVAGLHLKRDTSPRPDWIRRMRSAASQSGAAIFAAMLRLSGTLVAVQSYRCSGSRASPANDHQHDDNHQNRAQRHPGPNRRVLVEFDRQNQLKGILDKQAEYDNLIQQIRRNRRITPRRARRMKPNSRERRSMSRLPGWRCARTTSFPAYQAEINKANLAEAEAKLKQLKDTFALKREAQAAELRILEIQRDRAQMAVTYAQSNIEKMTIDIAHGRAGGSVAYYKGTRMVGSAGRGSRWGPAEAS